MLSVDEKKFVIEIWFQTKSYAAVRRAFRSRPGYHSKNLPSISTLQRVVDKFNTHGSILDLRKGKPATENEGDARNVERLCRNSQMISLRTAGRRLGISAKRVRSILTSRLLKKATKQSVVLSLTERQRLEGLMHAEPYSRRKSGPP